MKKTLGNSENSGKDKMQKSENNESENNKNENSESNDNQKENTKIIYNLIRTSTIENDTENLDWNSIQIDIENLNANWSIILIDLNSMNVQNQDILNFSNEIDNLIISAKNKDKNKVLSNIGNLYYYIPKYKSQYSKIDLEVYLENIKYFVLQSYSMVGQNKWEEVKANLDNAEKYFTKILNDTKNIDQLNNNYVSKIYVLFNELYKTINIKDKELFYLKYKNFMQCIEER